MVTISPRESPAGNIIHCLHTGVQLYIIYSEFYMFYFEFNATLYSSRL